MKTALFYYHYSDRNPAAWNITIDKNVSRNRTRIDYPFIKAYRVEPDLVPLGEIKENIMAVVLRVSEKLKCSCAVQCGYAEAVEIFFEEY